MIHALKTAKVRLFKDLTKMFKSSVRKKAFSMNHFGQKILFFIGCYFLEILGWNLREGP